jgi:hypothetical protein
MKTGVASTLRIAEIRKIRRVDAISPLFPVPKGEESPETRMVDASGELSTGRDGRISHVKPPGLSYPHVYQQEER